jgi:hypothetical protein
MSITHESKQLSRIVTRDLLYNNDWKWLEGESKSCAKRTVLGRFIVTKKNASTITTGIAFNLQLCEGKWICSSQSVPSSSSETVAGSSRFFTDVIEICSVRKPRRPTECFWRWCRQIKLLYNGTRLVFTKNCNSRAAVPARECTCTQGGAKGVWYGSRILWPRKCMIPCSILASALRIYNPIKHLLRLLPQAPCFPPDALSEVHHCLIGHCLIGLSHLLQYPFCSAHPALSV